MNTDDRCLTEAGGGRCPSGQSYEALAWLATDLLDVLNTHASDGHLFAAILSRIRAALGFEAGSIRLAHEGEYPFIAHEGFPEAFIDMEMHICKGADGAPCQAACFCGVVIRQLADACVRNRTEGGSFWTNRLSALDPSGDLAGVNLRGTCVALGYESMALVPIRDGTRLVGVLQLNDHRPNLLDASKVQFLERVGESLGVAYQKEQTAKREREVERELWQAQKHETIGTLAAGVAHELNNPLTGVLNYAQLLVDQLPEGEICHNFAGEIVTESNRMARIIRTLMDFARPPMAGEVTTISAADLIEGALVLTRTVLRHDFIDVSIVVQPDLPPIACVVSDIRQVLTNLIANARDSLNTRYANPNEGKRLELRAERTQLDGGEALRLSVRDYGAGATAPTRQRMFNPFFTTKNRASASGLGLTVSRRLIESHGGRISVDGDIDEGCLVHVDLPLADPAAPRGAHSGPSLENPDGARC